jgi:hypothetical protein
MFRIYHFALVFSLVTAAIVLLNCGGGSNSSDPSNMAMVSLSISDPPTCAAPQGPYGHIYVTITDVLIHTSANAGDNDPNWVDLTPNLPKNPAQVDLLGVANQCFLAMLGSTGISPGTYQQVRIILADNGVVVPNNKCDTTANCLMLSSDPSNPIPLELSSQAKTGIKIPSGQLAGGKFVVAAGDNKDLNIDFNACASIVAQGNGKYRLKPVLHGGEVALQSSSTSVSGTVVDSVTLQPIAGGNTVVALEQNQSGVDRVIMETVTGSNGGFAFCPVPAGIYDVVVTAVNGVGTAYGATVITGVQPGSTLGNVPLTAAALPASIGGEITSSAGSSSIAVDVSVSALQPIAANLLVTVPLAEQSASTDNFGTVPDPSCPASTDCANYTLVVPAANPSVGAFNSAGDQTPAAPAPGPVGYTVDANAFIVGTNQGDCTQSNLQTNMTDTNAPLTVTPGGSVTAATLAFTGCQ